MMKVSLFYFLHFHSVHLLVGRSFAKRLVSNQVEMEQIGEVGQVHREEMEE
jgi:hypothetical protein